MTEQQPLDGLRILIAEDNIFAAMELEATLVSCGCRPVGPAATVDQALRLARDEALDGAVLDVNLRDKPVFPVADELIKRGVQIIFATGYDDGYAFPEHLAGCVRLRKPYFEHELKRRLVQTFADGQMR